MIASCFVLGVVAVVASIRLIRFNNDIEVMLPRRADVLQAFHFFRDSPFADNVVLSFELTESKRDTRELLRVIDELTAKVDSEMILGVIAGGGVSEALGQIQEFVRLSPQILGVSELGGLDQKINPAYVNERLQRVYRTLLSPAPSMAPGLLQQDPLGLQAKALKDLRKVASASDYEMRVDGDHFVHKDGRRALVVLETSVSVTDGVRAEKLMTYLEELIRDVPGYVKVDLIAGHLHSISNERVIKRDIFVTVSLASIAFLAVFGFLFKDARALLLFLIPGISVVIAIHICSWVMGELSAIIMGMGAVISGIAVDYCIHVYVAMRSGQSRAEAIGDVSKPLIVAAFTTVGVFSAFFLSSVPGYRELALLTITSILLSLGFALCILPRVLSTSRTGPAGRARQALVAAPIISDRVAVWTWAVVMLGCMAFLPRVHFGTDVRQYDGTAESILRTEERFQRNWRSKGKAAMLVVGGRSFDDVLEKSADILPEIKSALGENEYLSLSEIWPSSPRRLQNLAAWNRYWTAGRGAELRTMMLAESGRIGFRTNAFDPFFGMLHLGPTEVHAFEQIGLLRRLKRRFAFETNDGYRLVNLFPDENPSVKAVVEKSKDWPGIFVVSQEKYARDLSQSILSEAMFLSVLIALIVPLLTFLLLRDAWLVGIALVPVVSAIFAIFGVLTALNLPVNAASVIALLVVGGLCIDYGIFMVHANRRELKTNISLGVTLSAATTFLGAGTLLMARHPVLVSFGLTMVVGILAAYVSAVCVVPALYRLLSSKKAVSEDTKEGYETV